jgi:hypothetical protein
MTGERNKRDSNREGTVKVSLFADAITLYLKDPKSHTKRKS